MSTLAPPAEDQTEALGARQLCTFYVDDLLFAVEVSEVQEVVRSTGVTRVPLAPHIVTGLINLRGQIVVTVDLRRRLGRDTQGAEDRPRINVVLRIPQGVVSIQVDRMGEVVTLPHAELEPCPPTMPASDRAVLHGIHQLDDKVLLVLDVAAAIETA